jgi:hypothetical protein
MDPDPGSDPKLDLNLTKISNLLIMTLKGQSHEKFGEMKARGLSLGHNKESLWVFKFF